MAATRRAGSPSPRRHLPIRSSRTLRRRCDIVTEATRRPGPVHWQVRKGDHARPSSSSTADTAVPVVPPAPVRPPSCGASRSRESNRRPPPDQTPLRSDPGGLRHDLPLASAQTGNSRIWLFRDELQRVMLGRHDRRSTRTSSPSQQPAGLLEQPRHGLREQACPAHLSPMGT